MLLDLAPEQHVLEVGTGAGAMTAFLARAVGREGRVVTVDRRRRALREARKLSRRVLRGFAHAPISFVHANPADHEDAAAAGSSARGERDDDAPANGLGGVGAEDEEDGDEEDGDEEGNPDDDAARATPAADAIPEGPFDCAVIDMVTPWDVLDAVASRLRPDGTVVVFAPNISQVQEVWRYVRDQARANRDARGENPASRTPSGATARDVAGFWFDRVVEVQHREWEIGELVARPAMAGPRHTGFLVRLRRVSGLWTWDRCGEEGTLAGDAPDARQ